MIVDPTGNLDCPRPSECARWFSSIQLTWPRRRHDVEAWLRTNPSAEALRSAGPDEWSVVQRKIANILATGVSSARVRFSLANGWILQRLYFERGLERKPVSMRVFRLLWPLMWQRRHLIPLVHPRHLLLLFATADRPSRRHCRRPTLSRGQLATAPSPVEEPT